MFVSLQWGLCISVKPFKFFVSSMTHFHKLEARANCKFHVDKSFGVVGYFNALSTAKIYPLYIPVMVYRLIKFCLVESEASYQSFTGSIYVFITNVH